MTGSHEHKSEVEGEACKKCVKGQKLTALRCGPERHSSFHDDLMGIMHGPKPKAENPPVRHRLECRGKPRHEPPHMEFEVDSAYNYLDERAPANPAPAPATEGNIKPSNFKSKAVYCEVKANAPAFVSVFTRVRSSLLL
jgi:hypothetical protein